MPQWEEGIYEKEKMFNYDNFIMELENLFDRAQAFHDGLSKAETQDELKKILEQLSKEYNEVQKFLPANVDKDSIMQTFAVIHEYIFPTIDKN